MANLENSSRLPNDDSDLSEQNFVAAERGENSEKGEKKEESISQATQVVKEEPEKEEKSQSIQVVEEGQETSETAQMAQKGQETSTPVVPLRESQAPAGLVPEANSVMDEMIQRAQRTAESPAPTQQTPAREAPAQETPAQQTTDEQKDPRDSQISALLRRVETLEMHAKQLEDQKSPKASSSQTPAKSAISKPGDKAVQSSTLPQPQDIHGRRHTIASSAAGEVVQQNPEFSVDSTYLGGHRSQDSISSDVSMHSAPGISRRSSESAAAAASVENRSAEPSLVSDLRMQMRRLEIWEGGSGKMTPAKRDSRQSEGNGNYDIQISSGVFLTVCEADLSRGASEPTNPELQNRPLLGEWTPVSGMHKLLTRKDDSFQRTEFLTYLGHGMIEANNKAREWLTHFTQGLSNPCPKAIPARVAHLQPRQDPLIARPPEGEMVNISWTTATQDHAIVRLNAVGLRWWKEAHHPADYRLAGAYPPLQPQGGNTSNARRPGTNLGPARQAPAQTQGPFPFGSIQHGDGQFLEQRRFDFEPQQPPREQDQETRRRRENLDAERDLTAARKASVDARRASVDAKRALRAAVDDETAELEAEKLLEIRKGIRTRLRKALKDKERMEPYRKIG